MLSADAINEMLDGLTVDTLSLHTGDPGSDGTANEVTGDGYERKAATFAAAAGGERVLSSSVQFAGPANEDAAYLGLWESTAYKGKIQITSGDTTFNASGEFTATTGNKITLANS